MQNNVSILLIMISSIFFLVLFFGLSSVILFESPFEKNTDINENRQINNVEQVEEFNKTELKQLIHKRVNIERRKRGRSPLKYDQELSNIAFSHSQEMAKNNYLRHDNLDGQDVSERYDEAGYNCKVRVSESTYATGGENILFTYYDKPVSSDQLDKTLEHTTMEQLAKGAVNQWMNSPEHRRNLLKHYWNKEGIGVYMTDQNKVYVTQNFC